ncbi:MAG: hypothetical protein JSW50_05010 [Candidatus Latescibacterota bacterium]|nr:MAG: hypothetical protein JSW50_05010 [Candidatus Latescibacterota bacterium]
MTILKNLTALAPTAIVVCVAVTLAFTALTPGAAQSQESPTAGANATSASMRGIFTALTTAYAYSLDMEFFEDRHNRDTVLAALQALVNNTEALETHGAGLDPSFDYLRHSLAEDAYDALEKYQNRQFLGSKFMLNKLVENCATCHARLPADEPFETGAKFLEDADIQSLPPVDRVNIEVATRQFDRALVTYEEIFQMPKMTPPGLRLIGAFEGYFKLCIGVVENTERPIRTLETYQSRDDIPQDSRTETAAWIGALKTLDLAAGTGRELAAARDLIAGAEPVKRPPSDRSRLVEHIAAASLLHRYLQNASTYDTNLAEAFYLLAVAESHISRSQWISETEFLLEQSIKAAPESDVAKKAKRILSDWQES